MFSGAFLWLLPYMNPLAAQEITVPDYSYGEVYSEYGTVTQEGVADPGPYGGYSTGQDERSSGVFLAHGYRSWGYPSNVLLICGQLPKFDFPGSHGVYDMSSFGCSNPPIGYKSSWGGVVADVNDQEISCLTGARNKNGPTAPYCIDNPFGGGQICYGIPTSWGFGSSYGYMRKVFVVQSTGQLKEGDPVDIKASLTLEGDTMGDGTKWGMGLLFLNKPSGLVYYPWIMPREYLRWGDIEDIEGTPEIMNNMLGNLFIGLNSAGDTTTTVAIGDTIVVEVALKTLVDLDNPRGQGEAEGWTGGRPDELFNSLDFVRDDSVKSLIKRYGTHLSYELVSLTTGALLEPLTPNGPNLDTDGDGVTDTQEKGPDGINSTYDGNADGIPDYQQDTVASLHTYDGAGYFTFVIPGGTKFASLHAVANPSFYDTPKDTDFPFGFFDFSIDGVNTAGAIQVKIIIHNQASVNSYYKYGPTPDSTKLHWYKFMYDGQTGAEINQNTIILHLVDGQAGDEDIAENGYINDPGGIAAQVPKISVSPGTLDFIDKDVGDTSEARTVIVKNIGSALLQIEDVSIVWPDSVHFTITNNTCTDLEPDDTCSVQMIFHPRTPGDKEARLKFRSNACFHPEKYVVLKGRGLAPMIWDYGSLAFGQVPVGDSAVHVYTIKNKGNTYLTVQSVVIQEGDATEFSCSGLPDMPFNLEANDSVQFKLIFKPTSLGDKTSTLKIFTTDLDLTRTLTGTGAKPAFTIEGFVDTPDGDTVTEGTITVYEPEASDPSMWWKPLEGAHSYSLSAIPKGEVTLWFKPDTSQYPGYLLTYLGNKTVYSDAEFFNLNKDTSGLKITLVPVPPPPGGTSDVSGMFAEESGKSGSTLSFKEYKGNGTPVKNVSVFLVKPNGDLIDFDRTDSTGSFAFTHIPVGHYGFQADYVGFFMNEKNDSLIIDQDNQKYYISAVAVNDTITIAISNITGVDNSRAEEFFSVFPNPVRDNVYLRFGEPAEGDLQIRLIGMDGAVYKTLRKEKQPAGALLRIPVSDLPPGLYILSVEGKQINYKSRIIIMR